MSLFFSSISQLPHSYLGMSHSEWVLNCSASHYMPPDSSSFAFVSSSPFIPVMTTDDTLMPLTSVGFVVTSHLSHLNVFLIPKLTLNLAYIGQLCDSNDYLVIFSFLYVCKICSLRS